MELPCGLLPCPNGDAGLKFGSNGRWRALPISLRPTQQKQSSNERTKKKTCLILFCLINREGHVILPCNAVAERKLLIVIEGQVVGGYSAAIFIKSLLTNWLRK